MKKKSAKTTLTTKKSARKPENRIYIKKKKKLYTLTFSPPWKLNLHELPIIQSGFF